MNLKEALAQTVKLITQYYDDDLVEHLDIISDDIIWMGPTEGSMVLGKQSMAAYHSNTKKNYRFSMGPIESHVVKNSTKSCEVILIYKVFVYSEPGAIYQFNQRLQCSWVDEIDLLPDGTKEYVSRIRVINISNGINWNKNTREEIISMHPAAVMAPPEVVMAQAETGERVVTTGIDKSQYFFLPATISWIETTDGGVHSKIHVIDREAVVLDKLSDIHARYSDKFIKIHESYLVNPCFVKSIQRFSVDLVNGPRLPIPEKKYTSVKKQLIEFFDK